MIEGRLIVYPDADGDMATLLSGPRLARLEALGAFTVHHGRPTDEADNLARIDGAAGLLLGWERASKGKAAGLRTKPPLFIVPSTSMKDGPLRSPPGPSGSAPPPPPLPSCARRLGKPLAPGTGDVCIEKNTPSSWFCIEPVDWPDEIAAAFQVRTTLYRETQAIVRYDKGAASQFHTLFPTGNFEAIVGYFTASLGAPGKQSDNWAILPAEPNRPNRTVRWRGAGNSVLEIREIDDLRWSSMPDTRHGVVRMYAEDPDPVFRHVSWSDFMLARIPHKQQ